MVTWTTYGNWLQGDEKGYVKHGKILSANQALEVANRDNQKKEKVLLNSNEIKIVRNSILEEAKRIEHEILELAVCRGHVHLVGRPCKETIEQIVSRYKNISMFQLRKQNRYGRIWTRGFDKRFCFDNEELDRRINYVRRHG